jgi:hypothetical protein
MIKKEKKRTHTNICLTDEECVHHPRKKKRLVPEADFDDTDCVYLFRDQTQ